MALARSPKSLTDLFDAFFGSGNEGGFKTFSGRAGPMTHESEETQLFSFSDTRMIAPKPFVLHLSSKIGSDALNNDDSSAYFRVRWGFGSSMCQALLDANPFFGVGIPGWSDADFPVFAPSAGAVNPAGTQALCVSGSSVAVSAFIVKAGSVVVTPAQFTFSASMVPGAGWSGIAPTYTSSILRVTAGGSATVLIPPFAKLVTVLTDQTTLPVAGETQLSFDTFDSGPTYGRMRYQDPLHSFLPVPNGASMVRVINGTVADYYAKVVFQLGL